MPSEPKPPQLSDAEWKVMRCLWSRSPASARDVMDQVGGETEWAYTTVKTLLARLVEKGAARASMRGNTSLYEPVLGAVPARRAALRTLLDRAFDGTFGSLLLHLVEGERLSRKERERLQQILAAEEGRDDPRKRRGRK